MEHALHRFEAYHLLRIFEYDLENRRNEKCCTVFLTSFKNQSVEPERNEKLKILHFSRSYGILRGNAFKKSIRSVRQRVIGGKKRLYSKNNGDFLRYLRMGFSWEPNLAIYTSSEKKGR